MNKLNRILVALLVVQLVILAVVSWPKSTAGAAKKLMADLDPERVVEIVVDDADGNRVRLTKGEAGWVLAETGDFPVQEGEVETLLDKLAEVRTEREVAHTPLSHKQLKVADDLFVRRVELGLDDGTRHVVYLGTSPRYQVTHVRRAEQDSVYLVTGLSASDAGATPANWIDTLYFSVPQDEMVSITLQNANGRFELSKGEDGAWTMAGLAAGETVNQNNVSSLVTRVSSVRMLRPLGREEKAEYGMDAPLATVTVVSRDAEGEAKTHILYVGNTYGEQEGYVIKSVTSPYYVLAADYTVEDLLTRSRDSFIQLPPTPTPEITPTPEPATMPEATPTP